MFLCLKKLPDLRNSKRLPPGDEDAREPITRTPRIFEIRNRFQSRLIGPGEVGDDKMGKKFSRHWPFFETAMGGLGISKTLSWHLH
jgi:hypothetical protein